MRSWSVVENFSLNCLLISISGKSTIDRVRRWQAGWKSDVEDVEDDNYFLFFNFFL